MATTSSETGDQSYGSHGTEGLNGAALHEIEAAIVGRLRDFVRKRPMSAIIAAAGLGATLGGIFFSRWARLVFIAAAGYVGTEMWRREGRIDVQELLAKWAK